MPKTTADPKTIKQITVVQNGIHRPDEPRHWMRAKEPQYPVTATYKGKKLAKSTHVLKVQEVGKDLYDPVFYFPKEDVNQEMLEKSNTSTHCPLKGDSTYYHVRVAGDTLGNASWAYDQPFEWSQVLKDHIAFDDTRIMVEEHKTEQA